jgi:hypothetical protein
MRPPTRTDCGPSAVHLSAALITGSLGYGATFVLNLLAVRSVGAARQAAYFATGLDQAQVRGAASALVDRPLALGGRRRQRLRSVENLDRVVFVRAPDLL